jgi:hypothetical protein
VKKHVLEDKVITGISLAPDRESIRFDMEDGFIVAYVRADCCSYTWIEHVELPALGFPAQVISVKDLDMPDVGDNSEFYKDPDVLAFYGLQIHTSRGEIVIDYRNDSNGYYGGSLEFPDRRAESMGSGSR